ncbi:Thioredoxin [Amphibacillus marinus]|uniref:Thioredoxin n=1 Tax=Amphibacillus marinus TaxID=872970 RepID=A0A1H8TEV3_9BACI|nr:thioredoxin family protein [Amphibacillus marinus]SEO89365.1 Thioredoxin [Amphibacillus marinus]
MKKYKLFLLLFACLVIASCKSHTNKEFGEVLPIELVERKADALVYFGRDNCSSCKLLGTRIQEVLALQEQEVYYVELNALAQSEKNHLLQYDIEYTPYFVELRNGKIINEFDNYAEADEEQTLDNIKKFLLVHSNNRELSDGYIEIDFSLSIEEIENSAVNTYIEEPELERNASIGFHDYYGEDCYEDLVHVSRLDPAYLSTHKDELDISDDGWVTVEACFE